MFLDGLRALAVSESGRDEVFITSNGVKIWPTTSTYVSMAQGQRVEVDKCVTISRDANRDYGFCCGDDGGYRLGALA
ncbi:hypothetical protein [Actinomadura kijaniata]|uniref:hypothetical protein n=1 Tax=Actinomadura kijaniata TaxID=46161 RepID=UPI00082CFD10|nr:hypothetical protein [Actinomadura kijaniata]